MLDLLKERMGTRLTSQQYDKVIAHVAGFSYNTVASIERAARWWELEYSLAEDVLKALVDIGILKKHHAVRCPECGLLLEKMEYTDDYYDVITCYGCDDDVEVDSSDINDIYSLVNVSVAKGVSE